MRPVAEHLIFPHQQFEKKKKKEKEENHSTPQLMPNCTVTGKKERKLTQKNVHHKWAHGQVYEYIENTAKGQNAYDQMLTGACGKSAK